MKIFNTNSSGKVSGPVLVLIILLSVSILVVIITQFKRVHLSWRIITEFRLRSWNFFPGCK